MSVCYLTQTHSNIVIDVDDPSFKNEMEGDALFTFQEGKLLTVTVADCGNITLIEPNKCCAIIHAGWKSAQAGIIKNTIEKLQEKGANSKKLQAFVGPMIATENYEVGQEFAELFAPKYLVPSNVKFKLDLRSFINDSLSEYGVTSIYNHEEDTYSNPDKYYSYRRSKDTGRLCAFVAGNACDSNKLKFKANI